MTPQHLPFPHNLTPAERKAVEMLVERGKASRAARAIGIETNTINSQLAVAREKADVDCNLHLALKYIEARNATA